MWSIRYAVLGNNEHAQFPIDMLRYDAAFPAQGADASAITASVERSGNSNRPIELCHYSSDKNWSPSAARWASFGWLVTEVQRPARA